MNTKLLVAASASTLFLLAGCATGAGMSPAMSEPAMSPSGMMSPSAMMAPSDSTSPSGMMMTGARYVTYDTWSGSMSDFARTTPVLFFFSASDTASKALDDALTSEVSKLPDGTTVVKVDRDAMMSTADKYQVKGPHTFVILDADGAPTKTFQATTVDELVSYLKG